MSSSLHSASPDRENQPEFSGDASHAGVSAVGGGHVSCASAMHSGTSVSVHASGVSPQESHSVASPAVLYGNAVNTGTYASVTVIPGHSMSHMAVGCCVPYQ